MLHNLENSAVATINYSIKNANNESRRKQNTTFFVNTREDAEQAVDFIRQEFETTKQTHADVSLAISVTSKMGHDMMSRHGITIDILESHLSELKLLLQMMLLDYASVMREMGTLDLDSLRVIPIARKPVYRAAPPPTRKRILNASINYRNNKIELDCTLFDNKPATNNIDPLIKMLAKTDLELDFILTNKILYAYHYDNDELTTIYGYRKESVDGDDKNPVATTFTVIIPYQSDHAVYLLAALDDYYQSNSIDELYVAIDQPTKLTPENSQPVKGSFSLQIVEALTGLAKRLHEKDNTEQGQLVFLMNEMQALCRYAKILQLPFSACLDNDILMNACLLNEIKYHEGLLDPELPAETKLQNIAELMRINDLSKNAIRAEPLLRALHQTVIARLFGPCIGKPDVDGAIYAFSFTEYLFLCQARFVPLADGCISIKPTDGDFYKDFYLDKKERFAQEIRHLGNVLGFEFVAGIDFNKEIIFTPPCAERLTKMGVLLSSEYLALQEQHRPRLFKWAENKNKVKTKGCACFGFK